MLHNQCQTLVSALAPKRRKIAQVFNLPSIGSQVWLDLQPSKSCNFYPSECQICWLQTSHPSGLLTQLLHQLGHTHTHTHHTHMHPPTHTHHTDTHTHTTHTHAPIHTHTYTHTHHKTHTYTSSQLPCACTIHVQYHGAVYTCPDLLTGPAVASVQMARMLCT